jgi:hypothetical protein
MRQAAAPIHPLRNQAAWPSPRTWCGTNCGLRCPHHTTRGCLHQCQLAMCTTSALFESLPSTAPLLPECQLSTQATQLTQSDPGPQLQTTRIVHSIAIQPSEPACGNLRDRHRRSSSRSPPPALENALPATPDMHHGPASPCQARAADSCALYALWGSWWVCRQFSGMAFS